MRHMRWLTTITAVLALGSIPTARAAEKVTSDQVDRLERSRAVFQELRTMKDKRIPDPLIERARCVAVFPGVVKGALGWGARHGHGVMSCRDASGHWGPPIFLTVTGGSFGLQLGVEKADVVLFFMTDRGARSLVESKFTLGAKAGVAAGPVGRTAEASTDLKLDAEIYSYARSKGLFAGVSLEGAKIAPDMKSTRAFYGETADAKAIVFEHHAPSHPAAAQTFEEALP